MKKYVPAIISLAMLAYLCIALAVTQGMASSRPCAGVDFVINDTSSHPFVTVERLNADLGDLLKRAPGRPLAEINTAEIERRLRHIDKIETARALILSNGHIRLEITPMRPVARVFDENKSYYINKDGKRMKADARYHMDVPIITGPLERLGIDPMTLLPLITTLSADPLWSSLVTEVRVRSSRDIFLVPAISGHVANLGSLDDMDDKLWRLRTFYREVMPHKGWTHYDTISVKWRGQVVATRAQKGRNLLPGIMADVDDADDATTMLPTDDALERLKERKEQEKKQLAQPAAAPAPSPVPPAPSKPDTLSPAQAPSTPRKAA